MRIAYFYNEKLPKRTAHDAYVWRSCYYLSRQGEEVTLITGPSEMSMAMMQLHYMGFPKDLSERQISINSDFVSEHKPLTQLMTLSRWEVLTLGTKGESLALGNELGASQFHWIRLSLLRKSRLFKISWNLPFFWRCQLWMKYYRPEWAIFSVYKQARFHLQRRVPGIRYLFEVQDLAWYPPSLHAFCTMDDIPKEKLAQFKMQCEVLSACDKVTTTTWALKEILQKAPYNITTPIEVVPLGSEHGPLLTEKSHNGQVCLGYVGQLYPDQGVDALIRALARVPGIVLEVVGGSKSDLERIQRLVSKLEISSRVRLHGFVSPSAIASRLINAQALVAPFYLTRHMRYVAHTKLTDYGRWALPVVAPAIEGIESELRTTKFLFDAEDYPQSLDGLINVLRKLKDPHELAQAQVEIDQSLALEPDRFNWNQRCEKLQSFLRR